MVDFEVQTEAKSGARETLRPAQWQDETDSPLTSNESSPGMLLIYMSSLDRSNAVAGCTHL